MKFRFNESLFHIVKGGDIYSRLLSYSTARGSSIGLFPIGTAKVKKAMEQMKKKKSSGRDRISQECLLIGKD